MELADTDNFFRNLRDSYKVQYDAQRNLLNNQRRQQQASIMSGANTAGMLYSNLPQRSQIQYDTNTYMPALTNLGTTYQTGLSNLRNKGTQLANNVISIQEAISDLNQDIYASI